MEEREKRNGKGQTLDEFLAEYEPRLFDKPAVTADCLIFAGDDSDRKVLTVVRGNHPCIGEFALPGGFCERGESSEQTALRELEEETGARFNKLSQLCFVSTPNRDPRDWIMTVCYMGVAYEPFAAVGGDDAADAVWADVSAEWQGDTAVLTLTARGRTASARLSVVRDHTGKIDLDKTICDSRGIAFDHAKIILLGLESLTFGESNRLSL